jgi:hypothetical protein
VRASEDLLGAPVWAFGVQSAVDAVWLPDLDGDGRPELALGDPRDDAVTGPIPRQHTAVSRWTASGSGDTGP